MEAMLYLPETVEDRGLATTEVDAGDAAAMFMALIPDRAVVDQRDSRSNR